MKSNIRVDNKAAIQAVNASYSIKLRYLKKTQRLSIARLNEILFKNNNINCNLEYINTKENTADMFTKALDPVDFKRHRDNLGMKLLNEDDILCDEK